MGKKVSLVLGSGGARGIVHISIIKTLLARGYEIDEVVGCSIGSLVGAAFATGNIDALEEWMSKLTKREVFRLMDFANPRFGLLKGERALLTLQEVFPDTAIEDLPITYSAIATDLPQEKEVVFRSGSVYQAIRASIAIPAVFRAVVTEGEYLVDGGLLNPVPVNHVQHTDNIVIAVNLDGPPLEHRDRAFERMNALDLLQESYIVMRRRLCNLTVALHKPDYIIDVPHNLCGIWEFDRSTDLLQQGYALADSFFGDRPLMKRG